MRVSESVEREFKLCLPDEASCLSLLARLTALGAAAAHPVRQVNHFFDTPGRSLRRAGLTLRLREENGSFRLTLKGPEFVREGALTVRPEEELPLGAGEARALLSGGRSPLDVLVRKAETPFALGYRARELAGNAKLEHCGSFENQRQRVGPLSPPRIASGAPLVFELDRTSFPGGRVERELEVEVPMGVPVEEVRTILGELFEHVGIPWVTAPSKAARLFRILDPQKRED